MNRYRVTLLAQADIDSAWFYIAKDRPSAADRMAARLLGRFAILAGNPEIGEIRADLGPGVRQSTVGNYVVLYRFHEDRVEVLRVIHGARDIAAEFKRLQP